MIKAVPDTNVLVSALWKRPSNARSVIDMIARQLTPCYNYEILAEYRSVLSRPIFKFPASDIADLLELIEKEGLSVMLIKSTFPMPDESDRVFYDVAKACGAYLITGNIKHFPDEPFVLTPGQFLAEVTDT